MERSTENKAFKLVNVGLEVPNSSLKLKLVWINTQQAAIYLQTSAGQIRNLTSRGVLPYYKLGRTNLYKVTDLDGLLEKNKRGGYNGNSAR